MVYNADWFKCICPAVAETNPLDIFDLWYKEMLGAPVREPSAMVLSTCDMQGRPSARVVLLKKYSERGFEFFTNLMSRKGREITCNPFVALVFDWRHIHKQVRVEGRAELMSAKESDDYYASRSRESKISALCSKQSQILESREKLLEEISFIERKFSGLEIPRPSYWGGIRVVPHLMEFWQEQEHRLHIREQYSRDDGGIWKYVELYP